MNRFQIVGLLGVSLLVVYALGYEHGKTTTLNAKLKDKLDLYAYQRALSMESDPLVQIQLQSKITFAEFDIAKQDE